jgi:hypothetical protein
MLKLDRSSGPEIDEPTEADIEEAIASIMDNQGSFVILEREESFLQTTAEAPDNLFIEYSPVDGPIYRSTSHSLSRPFVENIFKLYARRDSEWKDLIDWVETAL